MPNQQKMNNKGYYLEKIIDRRQNHTGQCEYLVKYLGYPTEEAQWVQQKTIPKKYIKYYESILNQEAGYISDVIEAIDFKLVINDQFVESDSDSEISQPQVSSESTQEQTVVQQEVIEILKLQKSGKFKVKWSNDVESLVQKDFLQQNYQKLLASFTLKEVIKKMISSKGKTSFNPIDLCD